MAAEPAPPRPRRLAAGRAGEMAPRAGAGRAAGATGDFAAEALPHLDRIHALARALGRGRLDPDELTQETFTKACAAYGRFTSGSDMRAWLTTILLNLVRGDHRRRRFDLVPLSDANEPAEPSCEVLALRNLDRRAVLAAVDRLPDDFRLAICVVDLAGLPVKDAAAVLGVPVGTVLSRLSRGRARLARLLAQTVDRGGGTDP